MMNAPLALLLVVVAAAVVSSSGDNNQLLYYQPDADYKYATSDPAGYFPTELVYVPVLSIRDETPNARVVTFGLPAGASLNLPVSSALLLHVPPSDADADAPEAAKKKKPAAILRPYNPIASHEERGSFSLLVKIYPGGKAGTYVGGLRVGDAVGFKQLKGNVKKFRHPFANAKTGAAVTRVTMVAGGTGIAPMLQALYPILGDSDGPAVRLLYGSRSPEEILLRAELDELQRRHPDRLRVTYVVGDAADAGAAAASCRSGGDGDDEGACGRDPAYEHGWIDEEKMRRLGYPPNGDGTSVVWICGVNDMYVSLAGSRAKAVMAGTPVHNLGFNDEDATVWRS